MAEHIIRIVEWDRLLELRPDFDILGSEHDNEVQRLEFLRPAGRENEHLILYFSSPDAGSFAPVHLGVENVYQIPNTLMSGRRLQLQAAFSCDEKIEHSNVLSIAIRGSLPRNGTPPESVPDVSRQLIERAFASARTEDGGVSFRNLSGTVVEHVSLQNGCTGHSPRIGENGNWWQWSDENAGRADTGIAAQGKQGKAGPQGEQGVQGENGEKGDPGDPAVVNGKSGAEILLDAADIPHLGGNIADTLQGVVPAVRGNPAVLELPHNRIESVTVYGRTMQAGSGEPSPDNVRSLTGLEAEARVQVSGVNTMPLVLADQEINGVRITVNPDKSITLNGTATAFILCNLFPLQQALFPPAKATISLGNEHANNNVGILFYRPGASVHKITASRVNTWEIFDFSSELANSARLEVQAGTVLDAFTLRPMVNAGEIPLPYQPWQGQRYALPASEPLYGQQGVCDERGSNGRELRRWSRRVLTGTEDLRKTGETVSHQFFLPLSDAMEEGESGFVSPVCSHLPVSAVALRNGGVYLDTPLSYGWASVEDFKNYLAEQHAGGSSFTLLYLLKKAQKKQTNPLLIDNPDGTVVVSGSGEVDVHPARLATMRDLQSVFLYLKGETNGIEW